MARRRGRLRWRGGHKDFNGALGLNILGNARRPNQLRRTTRPRQPYVLSIESLLGLSDRFKRSNAEPRNADRRQQTDCGRVAKREARPAPRLADRLALNAEPVPSHQNPVATPRA